MRTSEHCNEIFAALAKAQGQMTGAHKSANNPHFRSQYSDLAAVIAALQKPLSDNGLCHMAGPEQMIEGAVMVTTRIGHASGQWVETTAQVPLSGKAITAQTYGSAVSYGRRYGLQALTGLASVDDDGNAASEPVAETAPPVPCSAAQAQQIVELATQTGVDLTALLKHYKSNSIQEMTATAAVHAIATLKKRAAA